MFPNNMTGDPNQQNPTSIFGFENYPTQNVPSPNWQGMEAAPVFVSPGNYPFFDTNMQMKPQPSLGTFSFGAPRPSQSLVQFPFNENSGFGGLRCKRKTDSPPLQPCKQHITEEKMAEHMSKLHISSQTQTSPIESNTVKEQRLVLCEEMRKLKSDPILPQCLIDKMQRPCTALVLWQPPPRILGLCNYNNNYDNNNENSSQNRNQQMEDESEIDHNQDDMDL